MTTPLVLMDISNKVLESLTAMWVGKYQLLKGRACSEFLSLLIASLCVSSISLLSSALITRDLKYGRVHVNPIFWFLYLFKKMVEVAMLMTSLEIAIMAQ